MDRITKKPHYLSFEQINNLVEAFLKQHNYKNEIPVPIENIIETLGFNIIPSFQLNYRLGIEGFIIPKRKEIYVDKDILEHSSPNRYNSTLAHEIGHFQLHSDYMSEFSAEDDYIYFLKHFNRDWLGWIEAQAWHFARITLLPSTIFPKIYETIRNKAEVSLNIKLSEYEANEPDSIAEILSSNIAEHFQVSKELAKYRVVNYLKHKI